MFALLQRASKRNWNAERKPHYSCMTRQRTRNTACRINLIPSVKYCRQLSCFQFLKPETHRCRLSPLSSFTARLLPTPSHSSQATNRSSSFFESQQRKLWILILESPSFFFVSNYSLSLLLYCMYFSYFIRCDRSNDRCQCKNTSATMAHSLKFWWR